MAYGAILGQQYANQILSNLSNIQTALANLGAGVRPNLLDNAYFAGPWQLPINQKGKTIYTGSGYTIDRWYADIVSIVIPAPSGLSLENQGAATQYFYQKIKEDLSGKCVTMSTLVDGELYSGVIQSAPDVGSRKGVIATTTPFGALRLFAYADNTYGFTFDIRPGKTVSNVTAAKLEEGDTQTLAYQDSTGTWKLLPQTDMDYATQLAKCLRYQLLLTRDTLASGRTFFSDETSVVCFLPTPTAMRINPTFVGSTSDIVVYADGSSYAAVSVKNIHASNDGLSISFLITAGVGVKQSVTVNFKSGVCFDANL